MWQSLLRQPVVRAVGQSSRLPGRSEDTQRRYHRVRTSTITRVWGSHLPTGRAGHAPTRPRTLRHRHAERALSVTAAPPYCPLDVAVLPHPDRTTPMGLYCAVDLIDTAARKQQPFFFTAVIDLCARAGGIYATSCCHLAALGVVAIGSAEPATHYGSFRTPAERQRWLRLPRLSARPLRRRHHACALRRLRHPGRAQLERRHPPDHTRSSAPTLWPLLVRLSVT